MDSRHIYTVSEFTARLKRLVTMEFPMISVEGEISSVSVSGRGHTYFSIQDQGAVLSCILWSSKRPAYGKYLRQGDKIIVTGRIDVYERGGRYSLVAERIEPSGLGRLLVQLHQLRMKLDSEGLFDRARKRPLPMIPRKIGVVTALNGAAVRDIVKTVMGRLPTTIVVAPARVQGQGAAAEIIAGMQSLAEIPDVDVIIIGRGGGSFEDLFEFNDEALVRAVAASPVPVISAVGHERDEALTDLAADVRASTPTAAGQIVVPDIRDLRDQLDTLAQHMAHGLIRRVDSAEMALDAGTMDLNGAVRMRIDVAARNLHEVSLKLARGNPAERLRGWIRALDELGNRLFRAGKSMLKYRVAELERIQAVFDSKDPFGPLKRGYSILQKRDGRLVRDMRDVDRHEVVTGILKTGRICLRVEDNGECEPSGSGTG